MLFEDWSTICAIYGQVEYNDDGDDHSEINDFIDKIFCSSLNVDDDRHVRLIKTDLPNGGMCGTVYMTIPTEKVVFGRRVDNKEGNYRYFTLEKPPIIKTDFLYFIKNKKGEDDPDYDSTCDSGPSLIRLSWQYYPKEWPRSDQEPFRLCLAYRCNDILHEQNMAFPVCEFLEHNALSSYQNRNQYDDGWKHYVDDQYPDYQLIIMPPEMDRLYQPSIGMLIHPQKEAAKLEQYARQSTAKKQIKKINPNDNNRPKNNFSTTMEYGRYAMTCNWKNLYTTKCPICLDDTVLYSDGIVLPICQHYCCYDCFLMYIKYKIEDLKQYKTNPFICPVETCQRELPIIGFIKQYISTEEMQIIREWYYDLKHPPCWSLDRCLATKSCGRIGTMRRRYNTTAWSNNNEEKKKTINHYQLRRQQSHYIYCDECQKTWCELCLKRVYNDDDNDDGNKSCGTTTKRSTITNHHTLYCEPEIAIKFCRRYMSASLEVKQLCQNKYPWIVSYSQFCQHDVTAIQYIKQYGQQCPNCSTGVERIEGCFHMKCPTCVTHFCYECGTELFPPYYGTHHCWEENNVGQNNGNGGRNNNFDTDEQIAMALYLEPGYLE